MVTFQVQQAVVEFSVCLKMKILVNVSFFHCCIAAVCVIVMPVEQNNVQ